MLALVPVAVTWIIAPGQEVRSQQAVQSEQRRQADSGPPVQATVAYDYDDSDGYTYALAGTLSDASARSLSAAPVSVGAFEHLENTIAPYRPIRIAAPDGDDVPGRTITRLKAVLRGRHTDPVTITEIRARVESRRAPYEGTLVYAPAEGESPTAQVGFDLDSPEPYARVINPDGGLGERYSRAKFISLARGEPIVVTVSAVATRFYEWRLDLTVTDAGTSRVVTVGIGPEPVRSTGLTDTYKSLYAYRQEPPPPRFVGVPSGRLKDASG
ncbi:hypothetical protein [Jidongwangia harbinensis]|uniref:hypothetical protein n=1 Tax=Jidongwangia harbinensis TaxID=2878561 RepID=UPI001CDA4FB5|nr:hypothetical protein [Jidongwangia harbinensis]MCA2215700.1 hypothetical protein [Jidongwangia harbinensis]